MTEHRIESITLRTALGKRPALVTIRYRARTQNGFYGKYKSGPVKSVTLPLDVIEYAQKRGWKEGGC